MMSLFEKTSAELQQALENKEITIADLTNEAYTRIDALDGEVGAFLALNKEAALAEAAQKDGPQARACQENSGAPDRPAVAVSRSRLEEFLGVPSRNEIETHKLKR